jgi:hypothetical protein
MKSNDMLIGMRHLVLKQQMKLAELSEQNSQRRDSHHQHTYCHVKEDQMTAKGTSVFTIGAGSAERQFIERK